MPNDNNRSFREYVLKIVVRTNTSSTSEDLEDKLDSLDLPSLISVSGTLDLSLVGESLRRSISRDTSFDYEYEIANVHDVTGENLEDYL